MSDKQFIGSVQEKTFSNGGSIIKLGLKLDDLKVLHKNIGENGFVNIAIKQSQAGKWYAELDTWQPNQQKAVATPQKNTSKKQTTPPEDDLPF